MKNLFLALAFLFIGNVGFANIENHTEMLESISLETTAADSYFKEYVDGPTVGCYVRVTFVYYNEFSGMYQSETHTFYLGDVENSGFGAAICKSRAEMFVGSL